MINEIEKINEENDINDLVDTSDLENNEILQVKDDRLFHDLFNSHDMSTIEWIAKEILGCSIEDIHGKVFIPETRLVRVRNEERSKYVDLLIEQKNGKFILLELNNNYYGNPIKSIAYAINLLSSYYDRDVEIKVSKNKQKVYVKPVRGILVNLNWSPPKSDRRKEANPGKVITNWNYPDDSGEGFSGYCLKIFGINLDFYDKLSYDSIKKEDRFFKLLTVKNEKELKELTKDVKELDSYVDKIKDLSRDKDYRGALMNERIASNILKQDNYYTAYHAGIDKGIDKGISQGIEQNKREMVLEMHDNDEPLEKISKYTKLTLEEIQAIIDDSKTNLK